MTFYTLVIIGITSCLKYYIYQSQTTFQKYHKFPYYDILNLVVHNFSFQKKLPKLASFMVSKVYQIKISKVDIGYMFQQFMMLGFNF